MLQGQRPPFRLLVRATGVRDGRRVDYVKPAVSDAFVVSLLCQTVLHAMADVSLLHLCAAYSSVVSLCAMCCFALCVAIECVRIHQLSTVQLHHASDLKLCTCQCLQVQWGHSSFIASCASWQFCVGLISNRRSALHYKCLCYLSKRRQHQHFSLLAAVGSRVTCNLKRFSVFNTGGHSAGKDSPEG